MKIFCKILNNHKWKYYISATFSKIQDIRVCKRCGKVQEYKTFTGDKYIWVDLVQRTPKGAKQYFHEIHKVNI